MILSSIVGLAGFALFNKWPALPPIVRNGSLGVAFDAVVLAVGIEDLGQLLVHTCDFSSPGVRFRMCGSRGRIRTCDLAVNSRPLYR